MSLSSSTSLFSLCVHVQSAEERVPVWYIMDEFGSQVQHSDQPSCGMAPFFYTHGQVAYTVLWPLQDLQEGGEMGFTSVKCFEWLIRMEKFYINAAHLVTRREVVTK